MPKIEEPILNYWYRALHSPFGVEISVSDYDLIRQRLYVVRREAQDTDLSKISVCASPFDSYKIWLVKRKPTDETT